MPRSIRVRPDLIPRVKSAVKHNGFLRQQDLVEEVGLASSTVRNFLNGKHVDYATFVGICQKLSLEWRDFADSGEITELNRESEEAVIARYSTSEIEQTTPDTLDLAEREEAIAKPNIQIEENNTDQIEERIFRATEQLNRRGFSALVGIQALEEIAKDSSRYHWKIMELLAAFVRNAAPRKPEEGIPDDIQAALTVIGRRDPEKDPSDQKWTLNLSNTDIRGAILTEANLEGANLFAANLQEAKLFEANLEKAYLRQAKLQDAVLTIARLREASLKG
jgi:transcriptional regulator with XRE-family HTH domain